MTAITLAVNNGNITTSSIQVAEHFGKRHDTVLRAIDNLDCSAEFTERNFAVSEYLDSTGRSLRNFTITRDGFVFLCMGFTGKEAAQWKEKYIAAFNAMDAQLHGALPHLITVIQQGELATLIAERFSDGKDRSYAWGRFNNHFRTSSYKNLPADKFDDACRYIVQMPVKAPALPAPEPVSKISPRFREQISHVARGVSMRQYDSARELLAEAALGQLAFGATEAQALQAVENLASISGEMVIVSAQDIKELGMAVSEAIDAAGYACAAIRRIEQRSGLTIHGKTLKHRGIDPDYTRLNKLVHEVITTIAQGE